MNWLRSFIQGREAIHRKNKYILPPEDDPLMADVGRDAVAHMKKMGFEIDPKSLLGNGYFGKVFKATFAGAAAACKVVSLSYAHNVSHLVSRELDILRSELLHENIVTIYAAFEPPEDRLVDGNYSDKVYIFMELLSIDLRGHVEAKNGLKEEEAKFLFKQIAAGLKYIHSQNIAHRDVKVENVLLNADRTVAKLTDFGISVRVSIDPETGTRVKSGTQIGTDDTMAPQVHYISDMLYDAQIADVYSLGVMLFHIFENRNPFSQGLKEILLVQEKMNRQYVYLKHSSPIARSFIDYLMTPKEEERPTVTQALEHPWINSTLQVVAGRPSPKAARFVPISGRPASVVRPEHDRVSRIRADSLGRSRDLPSPLADLVLGPGLAGSGYSAAVQPPFVPMATKRIRPRDVSDTPPAAEGPYNLFLDRARLERDSNPRRRQGPGGSTVRPAPRRTRAEEMGFSRNFSAARRDRETRDEDSDDGFIL